MVEVDDVDGLDRGVGVGVRGEEGPPGVGEEVHRLLEELEAAHLRHAVVGEQHRHAVAAKLQLAQGLERLGAGLGTHHPERLAVVAAEIPGDGARDARVVVDGEQDRLAVSVPVGRRWSCHRRR